MESSSSFSSQPRSFRFLFVPIRASTEKACALELSAAADRLLSLISPETNPAEGTTKTPSAHTGTEQTEQAESLQRAGTKKKKKKKLSVDKSNPPIYDYLKSFKLLQRWDAMSRSSQWRGGGNVVRRDILIMASCFRVSVLPPSFSRSLSLSLLSDWYSLLENFFSKPKGQPSRSLSNPVCPMRNAEREKTKICRPITEEGNNSSWSSSIWLDSFDRPCNSKLTSLGLYEEKYMVECFWEKAIS